MPKTRRANSKQIRLVREANARKAGASTGRYYPADDLKVARPRAMTPGKTKLRASITQGTVLILLAGRHRGKRVVFLRQLPSGLLLVTGPYKVNGCPVRRVDQSYVIATSTKVDAAAAGKASDAAAAADDEAAFLGAGEVKPVEISAEFKAMQKAVDGALMGAINKVTDLKSYLNAKFTLSKGDRPHEMIF